MAAEASADEDGGEGASAAAGEGVDLVAGESSLFLGSPENQALSKNIQK